MSHKIFVTATNTDIGKSYVSELLLKEFANLGFRVAYVKPIETGAINNIPIDGSRLHKLAQSLNNNLLNINIDEVVPYIFELPSAPAIARNGKEINFEKIKNKIDNLEKYAEIIIIEGAGGLMTPIDNKRLFIDLIEYLNTKVLLISGSYLGSISDSLSARFLLNYKNINYIWAVNIHRDIDNYSIITEPFYLNYFSNNEYLTIQKNIDRIVNMLKSQR